MKLVNRQLVEGTHPPIYIGHRTYRTRENGRPRPSERWTAEYNLDGQKYSEALGTANKQDAIRKAHRIVQRIEGGHTESPPKRLTIPDLADAFMEMARAKDLAPRTVQKYGQTTEKLKTWAAQVGIRRASAFTEQPFWKFRQHLLRGLVEKTVYCVLMVVKTMYKWGNREGLLLTNPLAGISVKEPQPRRQPCFTAEQIGMLLSAGSTQEIHIFAVLAYAGLRCGEVVALRWSDILLNRGPCGSIAVERSAGSNRTKGRRNRYIPIHPNLRTILDQLPRKFDLVFTARPSTKHPDGGGPVDQRRLLRSLKRLCRRCKFPDPDQYKLHSFRHAFASMCAREQISHKYALEWMGHKSSDILSLYYVMYDDVAAKAIATINYDGPRPKEPRA